MDGESHELAPSKRAALLVYTATQAGDWVPRDELTLLLWGDRPEAKARGSLRQMLHHLGANELGAALEIEDRRLRFIGACDASEFRAACERADWTAALALWSGPFLAGWSLPRAPAFDDWIAATRETLGHRRRDALLGRAAQLERSGDPAAAADLLGEAWRADVLEEGALARQLWLLQRAGRTAAASEARVYRAAFEREMGFAADGELAALLAAAEAGDPLPEPERIAPPPSGPPPLPASAAPFVGRAAELVRLAALLADPEARLITIVGGGGMGKTRLALQAARQQRGRGAFPGGIYFAPLDALSVSATVPAKLAETFGLDPKRAEPLQRVAERVGRARTLLVLDNLEHLLDAAPRLAGLLRDAPGLTLLATSRERLNLAGEWLFPLEGLTHSSGDAPTAGDDDAAELFLTRARQVDPGFAPDAEAQRGVERICRLVEGSPLAIELAAALLRVLPPTDIADELERDPDVLASGARDAPDRHRSVRTVFEHSWALLEPDERAALRRLAVFRGGFTRRAAAEVAGAPLSVLASLVDKSLLRADARGRYDRHPLVYHYTCEKLALEPDEEREAAAAHAAHFARFSAGLRLEFNGPEPRRAMDRLAAEFENCRAAWAWALAERNAGHLHALIGAVWFRFGNWDPDSEAIEYWEEAAEVLDADDPEHRDTLGAMMILQAQYHANQGDERANTLAESGLALLGDSGNQSELMSMGLGVLCWTAEMQGRFDEALAYTREMADVVAADRPEVPLMDVARLEMKQGYYEPAKQRLLEVLALVQSGRSTMAVVLTLYRLGRIHLLLNELDAARYYYRKGLELAREQGLRPGGDQKPGGLVGLARVALACDDHERARELATEVVTEIERAHEAGFAALIILARVAVARGEHDLAERDLRRTLNAIQQRHPEGFQPHDESVPDLLLAWSELHLAQGRPSAAAAMLGYLLAHTHAAYHREAAEALLEHVGLPEAERSRARREGERLRFEEVVEHAR